MGRIPRTRAQRRRRITGPGLAAAIVAAALAAAGCSVSVGGSSLDTEEVQTLIVDGYQEDGNVAVEVACPDDVESESGGTFTCEVTGPSGDTADIEVRQVDDDGNVRFGFEPIGLVPGALEAQIVREFQQRQGVSVTADCPSAVAALRGNVFSCTVTAPDGDTARIEVTQRDDSGNVRWRVVSS